MYAQYLGLTHSCKVLLITFCGWVVP